MSSTPRVRGEPTDGDRSSAGSTRDGRAITGRGAEINRGVGPRDGAVGPHPEGGARARRQRFACGNVGERDWKERILGFCTTPVDLVLERLKLGPLRRPAIDRRLTAVDRPADRVAMQTRPATDLALRQPTTKCSRRISAHCSTPTTSVLPSSLCADEPRLRRPPDERPSGPLFTRRRWPSFHPAPTDGGSRVKRWGRSVFQGRPGPRRRAGILQELAAAAADVGARGVHVGCGGSGIGQERVVAELAQRVMGAA